MKTSICFQCECQALCPTGQVQPREATVCAITACSRFQSKDKQTNADRIRAMTDEELADFINDAEFGFLDRPGMCDVCTQHRIQNCYQCWLDWLRQEADE